MMSKLTSLMVIADAGPRRAFCLSVFAAILCGLPAQARAQLYVGNSNTVGLFDITTGTAINSSFVTGLSHPDGILVSGNTLFVANFDTNTILTYDATTGAPLNASFINTGPNSGPQGLALSGNTLYVANFISGTVGTYDATTGQVINASFTAPSDGGACSLALAGGNLYVAYQMRNMVMAYDATTGAVAPGFSTIIGSSAPFVRGLAVQDDSLFVANNGLEGSVSEYSATTGAVINASFISNLSYPGGLAISGDQLFVTQNGKVSEFDANTGASINPDFVPGMASPVSLAASPAVVPEPGSGLLLTLGLGAFLSRRRRRV